MARVYSVAGTVTGLIDTSDILEIIPGSTSAVQILSISLSQTTEFGDAAAEMLVAELSRGSGTASAGGQTMPAPGPHEQGDTADATYRIGAVTDRLTRTALNYREAFNIQAGWFYNPIPEERITLTPGGDSLILHLQEAPDDAVDAVVRCTFAEIG